MKLSQISQEYSQKIRPWCLCVLVPQAGGVNKLQIHSSYRKKNCALDYASTLKGLATKDGHIYKGLYYRTGHGDQQRLTKIEEK